MYVNMPVVNSTAKHPYPDTPVPKRFGTVSPFDPALFSNAEECAQELLQQVARTARYSPVEVARWLDGLAGAAARQLADAEKRAPHSPEFRRLAVDVAIQAGLGRFFAAKFRSAMLFSIYVRTGEPEAKTQALAAYRMARAAWVELADRGRAYAPDVSYGYDKHLRGHWSDRVAAIDQDIADMEKVSRPPEGDARRAREAVAAITTPTPRPQTSASHTPPARFTPGRVLPLELAIAGQPRVRLRYRRVNQEERWRTTEMEAASGAFRAAIPADYTESPYSLEYFFEVHETGDAWIYPGLGPTLAGHPYFVVRRG
jgi:hypothetical protein